MAHDTGRGRAADEAGASGAAGGGTSSAPTAGSGLTSVPTDLGSPTGHPTAPTGAGAGASASVSGILTDLGASPASAGSGSGAAAAFPAPSSVSYLATDLGSAETEPRTAPPPDPGAVTVVVAPAPEPVAPLPVEPVRGKTRVGLYEVLHELGRGGMGAVYKAWHPLRRKHVALKVIKPDVAGGEKFERLKELFLREGGILMAVQHENVVSCYDANEAIHEDKPVLYMALELLEGESLAQAVGRGPLPGREALRIARAVARALDALHTNAQRILHRDVKPANVFIQKDGSVKLLDFGLAAVADWRLTQVSMFAAGSRPFMSPEQFDGLRFCTERSDLYSLGITLFQMVAGKCPFEADTDQGFLEAHKRRSPPSLLDVSPGLERGPLLDSIQNIVTRLLAKKPDERYPSATALIEAIDVALGGGKVVKPQVTRPEAERLRRRIALVAVALLVLAIASVAGVVFVRSSAPAKLKEAQARLDAFELDAGREIVASVLESDKDNQPAQKLMADINGRLARRADVLGRRDLARKARADGKLRDAAVQAEAVAREAAASGVFPPARIDELAKEATAAERARAEAWEAAVTRAAGALTGADLGATEAALLAADAVARTDAERTRIAAARRERDERADVDQARRELDAGEIEKAATRLDELLRKPPLPEVAPAVAALTTEAAEARRVREQVAEAEIARRQGNAPRAEALARLAAEALEHVGPPLERRVGRTAADVRAIEAAARRAVVLAAVDEAEAAGDAARVRAAVRIARAAVPADDAEARALLDRAEERACARLHEAAVAQAEAALRRGEPEAADAAEAAAREALRVLPPAEAERFRRLARESAADRAARGEVAARDALRERLRQEPRAERAWLLLEGAVARKGRGTDERLVERLENLTLGSEDANRQNAVHVVSLAPFYLDATEVASGPYAEYLAATPGAPAPAVWTGRRPAPGRDKQPVRGIGFEEAKAYAAASGKRLPTADEWEAAASIDPARPGVRRPFPWGSGWIEDIAPAGADEPRPSGTHPADRSPWDCVDMGGNIQEWTVERRDGREVPVLQGGSFANGAYRDFFRSSNRTRPDTRGGVDRFEDAGLRRARDVPAPDLAEWERQER